MSRRVFSQTMKEVAGIVYNIAVVYYARSGNGMTHYVELMNYDFMMAGVTPLNNDLITNAKSVWKFFDKLRPQKTMSWLMGLINGFKEQD